MTPHRTRRAQFWLAGDEDLEAVTQALQRVQDSQLKQERYEKRGLLPPPEPVFPRSPASPTNQSWWRMYTLLLLSTAAAATVVFPLPSNPFSYESIDSLEQWATSEAKVAWNHILSNIGPVTGAADGIVIASPSTGEQGEPDYFYTWTRDAALTVSSLLPEFMGEEYLAWNNSTSHTDSHPLLEGLVRSYVSAQAGIQNRRNPSGDLWSGGLSEPKFTAQGQPFEGDWGRPQRDGPALRALALVPYAHWLLDRAFPADIEYVHDNMYNAHAMRQEGNVIKNDLEEVASNWHREGFDLWEEVNGRHLWTDAVSRRALQAGARLARRLDDPKAAEYYESQAKAIAGYMPVYLNSTWRATANVSDRTGLDAAILLAVIHTGSEGEDIDLSPSDPVVLASLEAYVLSFDNIYGVNNGSWEHGWLVGRYAEDIYDGVGFSGGNPWYITTLAVAHVLYAAKLNFLLSGEIQASGEFWRNVLNLDYERSLLAGTPEFDFAIETLDRIADSFMIRIAQHTIKGRMSEQIGRDDGVPRGARDLTWSYAAFLGAKRARDAANGKEQQFLTL